VRLSRTAKIVSSLSAILGLVLFLVILDLGVNAGQIHYGVQIDQLKLGGLTEGEAVDLLQPRGNEMSQTPIRFANGSIECSFPPLDTGWTPDVHRAVSAALRVGREGSVLHAAGQRIEAWFGGVKIHWPDRPNKQGVSGILDKCERVVRSSGAQLARFRMRLKIRHALVTWPRQTFHLPLKSP
jgi:hypothetical protein